jgi:deazaflavin-dependent oxidoreductase (nitroreductase family)
MSRLSDTVRWLGHQRWFAAAGRRFVPIDRWLLRHDGGRWASLARRGVPPSLLLTTTGRRSGQPRTQPLLYVVDGDSWVVIGSNWGQAHHPAWTVNLLANPDATVTLDGAAIPVRGVHATGPEHDRLWELLVDTWPAYRTYEERAGGRELRIFRLERR